MRILFGVFPGIFLWLVHTTLADPQPQPPPQGARPIYVTSGGGGPGGPRPQYTQGGFSPIQPSPGGPVVYARPPQGGPAYASTPKPVPLPSPNPVQPPQQRAQSVNSPRQGAPSSGGPPRYSSPLGDVQAVYGQNPSFAPAPPRNRYQPSQQQSKYSSQVKTSGSQPAKQNQLTQSEELEYEEEQEQEPDRLTLLLAESKFSCSGRKDGYYADEGLNCEVFHYCQDGGKHSWMCPNNFAFHQVHLICVPPSSDNICKQSANYHFVNEYLYRPINEKEAAATNSSLRYADRYYPDGYTPGTPLDEMLANYDTSQAQYEPRAPVSHKGHHGQGYHGRQQPQHATPVQGGGGQRNVFYSPESINIPLNQRRPQQQSRSSPGAPAKQAPSTKYEEEYEDDY